MSKNDWHSLEDKWQRKEGEEENLYEEAFLLALWDIRDLLFDISKKLDKEVKK